MKQIIRAYWNCPCGCDFDTIDFELVEVLENLIGNFQRELTIVTNGGNRCYHHNMVIPGAAKDSRHMEGKAANIILSGLSSHVLYKYLDNKYPNKYGLGLYPKYLHVDVRETRARWTVQG